MMARLLWYGSNRDLIVFSVRQTVGKAMAKNAIVIGASSGIGFALTEALLTRSFAVGACSRHLEPLQILEEKFSRRRCLVQRTEKAAEQILDAAEKRRRQVYITRRWALVAWLFKINQNNASAVVPANVIPVFVPCLRRAPYRPLDTG